MNRRGFLKALGAAIAVANLPTVVLQETPIYAQFVGPKKDGLLSMFWTMGAKWIADGKMYGLAMPIMEDWYGDIPELEWCKEKMREVLGKEMGREVIWSTMRVESPVPMRTFDE